MPLELIIIPMRHFQSVFPVWVLQYTKGHCPSMPSPLPQKERSIWKTLYMFRVPSEVDSAHYCTKVQEVL